jgi:hypothetical protein
MVAFGNAILSARRKGWETAYVDYQGLKDLIFQDPPKKNQTRSTTTITNHHENQTHPVPNNDNNNNTNDPIPHEFLSKLQQEIEKVSLFALHRQGEIAKALGALRQPQTLRPLLLLTPNVQHQPQQSTPTRPAPAEAFTQCAIELLHWQRFVCINAVEIRKIIKKFQKYHTQWRDYYHPDYSLSNTSSSTSKKSNKNRTSASTTTITADDPHLQQLANSAAVAAMTESLWQACREIEQALQQQKEKEEALNQTSSYQKEGAAADEEEEEDEHKLTHQQRQQQEWIRLHCTVSLIQVMSNYAKSMNDSFLAFLSNKSMIYTGQPFKSNPDESDVQALNVFVHFDPDTLLTMDAKRLQRIWENDNRFLESSLRVNTHNKADKEWGGVDSMSLWLNLMSTLLYTVSRKKDTGIVSV